ncbi:hypothetical protein [Posidoniimonas corsicana]|uniref:hypothetical protein n=1 Tax=Posidoniimonas corsicana TaxID=1938618 RepID=UPI0011B65EE7|nr:hypothetical protein [Posidoniimonas corsicana]
MSRIDVAPGGKLRVHVSAHGGHAWVFAAKARDVQTFAAFQRQMVNAVGVWADHASQHDHSSRNSVRRWRFAIDDAFGYGELIADPEKGGDDV